MIHGGKVHTEPSRRFLRFWPVQAGGSAAPATFLVLRLLESNPHFVGDQTTLYRKRDAVFLLSRNTPPAADSKEILWNNFGTQLSLGDETKRSEML